MKRRRFQYWLVRATIVVLALVSGVRVIPAHRAAASSSATLAALPSLPSPSALPSAFQASLSREAETIVSAVAADIDADGDLDIVGSDDHLGLVVLVNDGQGHFSRRTSQHTRPGLAESDALTVRDRGRTRTVSIQNERPTIASRVAPGFDAVAPQPWTAHCGPAAFIAALVSTRVPRAPPSARRS